MQIIPTDFRDRPIKKTKSWSSDNHWFINLSPWRWFWFPVKTVSSTGFLKSEQRFVSHARNCTSFTLDRWNSLFSAIIIRVSFLISTSLRLKRFAVESRPDWNIAWFSFTASPNTLLVGIFLGFYQSQHQWLCYVFRHSASASCEPALFARDSRCRFEIVNVETCSSINCITGNCFRNPVVSNWVDA